MLGQGVEVFYMIGVYISAELFKLLLFFSIDFY